MINVNQITAQLAQMPDDALKQYATLHKNDPYTMSLAMSESNRRKQTRQGAQMQGGQRPSVIDQEIAQMSQGQPMPEDVGIGALPARNMENMAEGGIVAFGVGGKTTDPLAQYEKQIRAEAIRQGVDPDMAMRLFRQESAGDTKAVSPKGAVGLGQMMIPAAREMGLKPEERTDPNKNIPASIGYFKKQLNTFKDPEKALAAYNMGPGNLEKHLAKNEGRLNMDPASKSPEGKQLGLPKETADYINKILPVGTAYAEPTVAAAAPVDSEENRRAAMLAQIPGGVPMAQAPAGSAPTGNDIVKGTAKTAYALGHNLLAVPAAGISTLARKGLGAMGFGPGADFEETLGRYSYSPDDAVSQQQLGGINQAISDLKIPAYIPTLGGVRGASRAGMVDDAAAIAKTKNLRLANSASEEAAAAALKKSEIARRALATDKAAATAAKARLGTNAGARVINADMPAVSGRSLVGGNLATGVNAAGAYPDSAAAATAGGIPDLSTAQEDFRRSELEAQKVPLKEDTLLAPPAADAASAEKPSWLTNDRALNLGLRMMAGTGRPGSGSALRDLMSSAGAAGIGTLAQEQEDRKLKMQEAENLARGEYYKGAGRKTAAEADVLESGNKATVQAAAIAQARMKDFASTMQGKLADQPTRDRLYNQYLLDAYNSLGIEPPKPAVGATGAPTNRQGWGAATAG